MQAPASPPAPGESELVTLLGNVQEAGRGAMKPRAIERAADEISANQNLSPGEQMLPIHPAILDTMSLAPCRPTRAVFLRERWAALTSQMLARSRTGGPAKILSRRSRLLTHGSNKAALKPGEIGQAMRELFDYIIAKQEPDIRTIAAMSAEVKPETVDEKRWARHVATVKRARYLLRAYAIVGAGCVAKPIAR